MEHFGSASSVERHATAPTDGSGFVRRFTETRKSLEDMRNYVNKLAGAVAPSAKADPRVQATLDRIHASMGLR